MLDYLGLLEGLQDVVTTADRLVMVHSSYKSLGGVSGGAETVVKALEAAAGPDGSVFFPTYGVDAWCNRHYWHRNETPSEMGAITETARTRPGSRRTQHPIHSFAVVGQWRDAFDWNNIGSYSRLGPFGTFHQENGLVVSIGVPWDDTMSFIHYVEEHENAHWRRHKDFAGIYVDNWGVPTLRSYSMSVRRTLAHITHVAPLYDEVLVPAGVVQQKQLGDATVSWFRCAEYYDAVAPLVETRPELFYFEKGWRE